MAISVEPLLGPISDEAPSGDDISFDPAYLEFEQAFEGRPESRMGDSVLEAEEPDWADVRRRAIELLERSRSLRVIVPLTVALMVTDGPDGLDDGLHLLEHAVVEHWATVHPELDPDDDDDPTERINVLAALAAPPGQVGDPIRFRERLREMPLVRSSVFGAVSLRDARRAESGEAAAEDGEAGGPDAGTIQAAVMEADLDGLIAARDGLARARARLAAVDRALTEHVGAGRSVDFGDLLREVDEAAGHLGRWLELRGHVDAPAAPAEGEAEATEATGDGEAAAPAAVAAAPAPAAPAPPGTIAGSRDVLAALARINEYYREREPSSPVPLVLDAARSLVSRDFLEISAVLTPDTVQVLQQIRDGAGSGGTDDAFDD